MNGQVITAPHGLAGTYRKYGCRCDPCCAANTKKMREWRANNPSRRRRDSFQARAYAKAEAMLRERHRDEFDQLYRATLAETMADYHAETAS